MTIPVVSQAVQTLASAPSFTSTLTGRTRSFQIFRGEKKTLRLRYVEEDFEGVYPHASPRRGEHICKHNTPIT
eukprot:scaffold18862_cov55-Attheya_sp.AAC.2